MTRVAVDAAMSVWLLQEKWSLPARSPIPGRDGDETGHEKAKTLACRYLNRRVSHFFQRIRDRVSAAYTMKLFHLTGMGVLRRARADRPKIEVFLSMNLAADLLADEEFITDADSRTALLDAGIEVFKSFGEGNRFCEPFLTPTGHSTGSVALVCLQAHLAVFTTKVREHLKLHQRVPGTSPRSNFKTGHRQTWEAELEVIDQHLMSQGDRQRNGLRLVDCLKDYRDLSVRPASVPEPLVPLSIASALEAFGAADRVWNAYAASRPYGVGPVNAQQSPGRDTAGNTAGVGSRDADGSGTAVEAGAVMCAASVAAGGSTAAGGSAGPGGLTRTAELGSAADSAAAPGSVAAPGLAAAAGMYHFGAVGDNGALGLGSPMRDVDAAFAGRT